MPGSTLEPQIVVERLGETSSEVLAAILLDERGELAGHAGTDGERARRLGLLAARLLRAADTAGARAGLAEVGRVEVSHPEGAVFGLRERGPDGRPWTLLAVTAPGVLSSLVHYDMRMALAGVGAT